MNKRYYSPNIKVSHDVAYCGLWGKTKIDRGYSVEVWKGGRWVICGTNYDTEEEAYEAGHKCLYGY